MKLHLPRLLRSAVLASLLAVSASSVSAATTLKPPTDLGDTMFVGDSITHGTASKSYRWELHKIFVDNGISYNEMGIRDGNTQGDMNTNLIYGSSLWKNNHAAQFGQHAAEIAGTTDGVSASFNKVLGTMRQWFRYETPKGTYCIGENDTPSTYFMLIGTNDLLGNNTYKPGNGLEALQEKLLGTKTGESTWSGTGDMDIIINTMRQKSGDDVDIVLLTVPTWYAQGKADTNAADLAGVRAYNEALKEWAGQKGVTIVQSDKGIIDVAAPEGWEGQAVASMFRAVGAGGGADYLHPNAQGDLIIGGNVAKALGYAGRTAGQERKSAADFALGYDDIRSAGTGWGTLPATIATGSTSTYNWGPGADLSHGFTVDFTIKGGVGNGSTGGWNTTGNFSVSVGDGTHFGTLNINEAYIQWGDTVLYSLDMTELTESLRIAYIYGNTSRGLSTGFYVWLDDQLIAEACGDTGDTPINGLTITNNTEGEITLKNLSLDGTGSWAPTTEGVENGNPLIAPTGTTFDHGDFPGRKDWCSDDELLDRDLSIERNGGISGSLNGKKGAVVSSGSSDQNAFVNSNGDYTGPLYVTLSGTASISKYWGFHGNRSNSSDDQTFTGNGYLRVVDLAEKKTYGAFFGTLNVKNGGIDGDLYVEFSSENLTINDSASYGGVKPSIAGAFQSSKGITGTYRIVINEGTFGHIIGGATMGDAHIGAVELFLNGGNLVGNIAAGGYVGSVGNRSITITGDRTIFASNVTMITAGAVSDATLFGGTALADRPGTVSGTATVTIAEVTTASNFSQWKGTLSGGQECEGRTLVFCGAKLPELKATIENFDTITLCKAEEKVAEKAVEKPAEVGLKSLGGAEQVVVKDGSTLTLLANTDGSTYTAKVDNNAKVVVAENVSLEVTGVSDDAQTTVPEGTYELAAGSSLTLQDAVKGNYSVELVDGSTLTFGSAVEGIYRIALNGGGTLNGASAAGVVGTVAVSDAPAAGACSYDLADALTDGKMQLTLTTLSAGSHVSNLGSAGVITLAGQSNIVLGSDMLQSEGALLETNAALKLAADATLNVDITAIIADLETIEAKDSVSYYLTQGDLTQLTSAGGKVELDATFLALDMRLEFTEDGALRFVKKAPANIYDSSKSNSDGSWGMEPNENIYDSVGGYDAVVVRDSTTIDLTGVDVPDAWMEDGLTIHNLMGSDEGNLTVLGDRNSASKVTLTNVLSANVVQQLEETLGVKVDKSLTYAGNINITDAELQVKHINPDVAGLGDADSTTVLKGNLKLQGVGGLTMTSGVLRLEGEASDTGAGEIRFAGHDGQLVVAADATLTVHGDMVELAGSGLAADSREHVRLEGGTLALQDGAFVGSGISLGNEDADFAGTLSVGSAALSQNSRLAHVLLHVQEGGSLAVGVAKERLAVATEPEWDLAGLTGSGAITGAKDIFFALAGDDCVFSGNLAQYYGTMTFAESAYTQSFVGVQGGAGWNVTNEAGGRVVFNLAGAGGNNSLTMGTLKLAGGSYTGILLDLPNAKAGDGLHLQELLVEAKASINIGQFEGTVTLEGKDGEAVTLATITVADEDGNLERKLGGVIWSLSGIRNAEDLFIEYSPEDKTIYVKTYIDDNSTYADYATNKNSLAGARMLWAVDNSYLLGGDLAGLDTVVYNLLMGAGKPDAAAVNRANEIMAAAAGAGVPTMGLAFSNDVERQLRTIRNRTTNVGSNGEDDSSISMWLNAETDYYKQDADGLLSGYKSNSWGGTVGVSSKLGENASFGLALTAMYGDLQADSADHLKGDMDTYYVTGFAQVAQGAWRHTFIATVGKAELDVERTVDYGLSRYKTKGSTDGIAFGAMYEVGYSISLNEAGDAVLQPIFNISFRHTSIDGYSETGGSNAALRVGSQELNAVIFGLGARYQTALDGNLWNRQSLFELRALVKARVGDKAGEASVAFQQHEGALRANVESASAGSVGAEFGASLVVPMGESGDVFIDASAELWSNYSNISAGVGYRVHF